MKKRGLAILFLISVLWSSAQYCGTSGPGVCSTTSALTTPGVSDFWHFPCVHDSLAYTESLQIFFPDSIPGLGLTVTVTSIRIDSITNLPCGLCWSCDNSSLTYAGGGKACIRITGTTYDSIGAYHLNFYGTATTSVGTFPGTLDQLGFQFYLNVIGKNDTCGIVNMSRRFIACHGLDTTPLFPYQAPDTPNSHSCNFNITLSYPAPVSCSFDSGIITITQPIGPGYQYHWFIGNILNFSLVDTFAMSLMVHHSEVGDVTVTDSSGCAETLNLAGFGLGIISAQGGNPVIQPNICYATVDSSGPGAGVKFVFERNNFFNNISGFVLFRKDTNAIGLLPVASSPSSSPGYITDPSPNPTGDNIYVLAAITICHDTIQSSAQYVRSVLTVTTYPGLGLPELYWTNSNPLNYDTVYVYSRERNGSWRLRYTNSNLGNTYWLDNFPDSTSMQYMLGYHLIIDCDPNRAISHYAFSGAASVPVLPALIYGDTTSHTSVHTAIADPASVVGFVIYPNPANDKVYIHTDNAASFGEMECKVYNMMGQLVVIKKISSRSVSALDTQAMDAGVYILKFYQDGQQIGTKRLVKE